MRALVAILVVSVAACTTQSRAVDADLAIVGVDVVPMTSEAVLRGRSVFMRDGVIALIADSSQARPTPGTETIDGRGRFLFPGLVDAHAHLRAEKALDLFLSYGITTIRNMHGGLGDPLTWEREIEAGRLRGPTLINASPILRWDTEGLTLPGPDPIRSFADVRRAVDAARDSGYATIKVLEFPQDAFDTLVAAATAARLPVAGHLPILNTGDPSVDMTLDEVLASGMAVVEHLNGLIEHGMDPAGRDSATAESLARRVAASRVAVTTTTDLVLLMEMALTPGSDFPNDSLRALALKYVGPTGAAQLEQLPSIWRRMGLVPIRRAYLSQVIRRMHSAGVPLMVGTDGHTALQVGGLGAIQDMLFLVESGLTPYDALAAMTAVPARVLGGEGAWGTLVEEARADALLLSENPLDDPSVLLDSVEGIVLRGVWLDRAELDAMRAEAESRVLYCPRPRCDT